MNNLIGIFLVYSFLCYGISNIVVFGEGPFKIFSTWRNIAEELSISLGKLFTCMMCFPTWVGISLSLINLFLLKTVIFTPFNLIFNGVEKEWYTYVFIILFDGTISSGVVWFIHHIEEFFESNKNLDLNNGEEED